MVIETCCKSENCKVTKVVKKAMCFRVLVMMVCVVPTFCSNRQPLGAVDISATKGKRHSGGKRIGHKSHWRNGPGCDKSNQKPFHQCIAGFTQCRFSQAGFRSLIIRCVAPH